MNELIASNFNTMKVNKQSKAHHFVSRAYLENFQSENQGLFVYDKLNSKTFISNKDSAGYENNFNSVDNGNINFEDFFQEVDKIKAPLIRKIISLSDNFNPTNDDLFQIALIICYQQMRVKMTRTTIIEFSKI